MDDTAIVKAEDAAAAPVTAAPKRSHHAKLARPAIRTPASTDWTQ